MKTFAILEDWTGKGHTASEVSWIRQVSEKYLFEQYINTSTHSFWENGKLQNSNHSSTIYRPTNWFERHYNGFPVLHEHDSLWVIKFINKLYRNKFKIKSQSIWLDESAKPEDSAKNGFNI